MHDDEHDELDELYIGYLPRAPRGIGRFVAARIAALVVGVGALALLLARLQGPFDAGTFEYGEERTVSGVLAEDPYPLLYPAPGEGRASGFGGELLLAGAGKHGAPVAGLDHHEVELRGSLVLGEELEMLSLSEAGVVGATAVTGAAALPARSRHGRISLVGEIVDSKCYLGVMKPGRGKPHRGCAARCLSGGIPPLFVVESEAGEQRSLLLVDPEGRPLADRLRDFVAEPLAVEGTLERRGDLLVLVAAPEDVRRLGG